MARCAIDIDGFDFVNCKLRLLEGTQVKYEFFLSDTTIIDDDFGAINLIDNEHKVRKKLCADDLTAIGLTRSAIEAEQANCVVGGSSEAHFEFISLTDGTWSPNPATTSFTLIATAGTPTFTGSNTGPTTLPINMPISYSRPDHVSVTDATPIVTAGALEVVLIRYTQIV